MRSTNLLRPRHVDTTSRAGVGGLHRLHRLLWLLWLLWLVRPLLRLLLRHLRLVGFLNDDGLRLRWLHVRNAAAALVIIIVAIAVDHGAIDEDQLLDARQGVALAGLVVDGDLDTGVDDASWCQLWVPGLGHNGHLVEAGGGLALGVVDLDGLGGLGEVHLGLPVLDLNRLGVLNLKSWFHSTGNYISELLIFVVFPKTVEQFSQLTVPEKK